MSDDDYSSEDYIEVVDQRPSSKREVRTEERERVTFLAEDRLDPEDRRDLEQRALEGAEEAEIYEESWTPSHGAELDEIHDYIDHRLDRDRDEDAGRTRETTTTDVPLRPEEAERLQRAVPGEVLDREVRYRTDSGSVVFVRYRAKDGDVQTTVLNIGPDRVRFLDDIQEEVDEQGIDIADLDLQPPEPPAGEPGRSRTRTSAEPETTSEPTETETEPAEPDEPDEAEAELEETVEEPDEPEEPEQTFSDEDLELAEELGIPPEELAGITDEEDEESGGLGGGLPFGGGGDEDEADEEGGGIGGGLPFGGGGDEADEDEDPDEVQESSGGFKDKLPFGKKPEGDADEDDAEADETDDAGDADEDDEEGGGFKDKLPFG